MPTNSLQTIAPTIIESLVIRGDLSGLNPREKVEYYKFRCSQLDIDPAEQPFQLLRLNGRELLYATKACTDALCRARQLKREITARDRIDDVYVVTCRCSDPSGRFDEATGAVSIAALKGEALANALMKSETKAKRRAVLSLCGLGLLDASELDTISGAQPIAFTLIPEAEDVAKPLVGSVHPGESPSVPVIMDPVANDGPKKGQALTPRREAWLLRVGQDSNLPKEAMDRCVAYLRSSNGTEVQAFFMEMSKQKGDVFRPFIAA